MRRAAFTLAILVVFVSGAQAAAPIWAGPPERMELSYADGTYTVVLEKQAVRYAYDLWVAQWCYDAEDVALRAWFIPVDWAGIEDPTRGTAFVGETVGTRCEGYVWRYPYTHDPVSNVVEAV